jgi:enoyl-CoA hydratase
LGVANGFIPSEKHVAFTEALGQVKLDGSDKAVVDIMADFQESGPMDADIPAALAAFSEKDVPSILKALDGMSGEWAAKQASTIRKKSPLALCVTFEAIKRGLELDFQAAMTQELDISLNFLKTQDFYEGIRAQLIDKDRNPKWSHDGVADVSEEQIERLFRETANPRQEFLS